MSSCPLGSIDPRIGEPKDPPVLQLVDQDPPFQEVYGRVSSTGGGGGGGGGVLPP